MHRDVIAELAPTGTLRAGRLAVGDELVLPAK